MSEQQKPSDGGPAFPTNAQDYACGFQGMSVRVWLAGQVLCGLHASGRIQGTAEEFAKGALRQADALIAELEKQG